MPLNKHFKGHGEEVMKSMAKTYGKKKAKNIFYATENKRKGIDTSPSANAKKKMGLK